MYEKKLNFYKKKILDELYQKLREHLKISKYSFPWWKITNFLINSPNEDTIFIETVWGELSNQFYIIKKANHIRYNESRITDYEREYHPEVAITFNDLLNPVLLACLEMEIKGDISNYFEKIKNYLDDHFGIDILENEIHLVMIILGKSGYLELHNLMGGALFYWGMTDFGRARAMRIKPLSFVDKATERLASRLLELDYYTKDRNQCFIKLRNWINQFNNDSEKLMALFLVENLFIASNEKCLHAYNKFLELEDELNNIDSEDIYLLAAGGPGSSGEAWRHKLGRETDWGKEQSRSLDAIKNKRNPEDWDGKYIIFIDDIIGSGEQFKTFFSNNMRDKISKSILSQFEDAKIIYFVVIATKQGIEYITQKTPLKKENIRYGYLFQKLFEPTNLIWNKTTPVKRDECLRICTSYGQKLLPEYPLGYLDSQLLIAFQDHTPDNTLPIFWVKNANWEPLLRR